MRKNLKYLVAVPIIAVTLAIGGCASSNHQRNYSSQENSSKYEQIQQRNTSKESALENIAPCIVPAVPFVYFLLKVL